MIKTVRSGLWTCSRCLRQTPRLRVRDQRRWLSSAPGAATQVDTPHIPIDHSTDLKHDDSLLRQIFDSPPTFKDFTKPILKVMSRENVGLFRNKYLTTPQGFLIFADVTVRRAQKVVDKVLNASTLEDYKAIVRDLDRLSDLLCRVLDVSDFVRVTHPDSKIQDAASEAWSLVYQYMNQLNTETGLSNQLGVALANPEVMASWNEEERTVAKLLQQDFMKSAIHLPKQLRDRFVDLSQHISELGSAFVEYMHPEQTVIEFPSSKVYGLDPQIARLRTRGGLVRLQTMAPEATVALRNVHDEDTRKAIYYATRTASGKSIQLLEAMLKSRAELAKLSGFESYGQMALHDKMMAKTPESVHQFLLALSKRNEPLVEEEIAVLLQEKRKKLQSAVTDLQPWDRDYYMTNIRLAMRSRRKNDDFLSAYFSLGTVMQGLSRLFTRLYGIRLVPRDTLAGETWHPDVRRLDVVSDTDGHVAVLYCDLFYRPDKSPNPAHFTVRCSREISEAEIREAAERKDDYAEELPQFDSPIDAANDGMHVSQSSGTIKQLPTIALVCDFEENKGRNKPALLDYYQMETLFHEMGHAIHSVLARTSLQNVAGTRCATDFAELPSTLMEHFCADPSVLGLFARHYITDEPLPYEMVVDKLHIARRFEASDRENQIILAMLDQQYHSSLPNEKSFDSTEIYLDLQRNFGKLPPDPQGTRWQGFFGHLFGYGSTYYSYLFDQVLSKRVWDVVFSAGQNGAALDRANGERLKENLLKWGGSRDPWRCLSDALQDERLVNGDEKAMRLVGSWVDRDEHAK
ncbi:mitochondrial intermediate peptidase-like protein [Annulohypoxylon maeteangense]|uniref:mitochondrial intermediate peptidase-like protein n=1 Tax=Annulohypoxylon maeteangense TaxID=1927788 RepID=UPI002008441F|nr:mitochondrial intermediate peptidase-like protein [Annulohypoxylon maeteangense]KAI0890530.1 mitochondrial intermediate peptidase-like protein [Annulohypoxylon maeteangense]